VDWWSAAGRADTTAKGLLPASYQVTARSAPSSKWWSLTPERQIETRARGLYSKGSTLWQQPPVGIFAVFKTVVSEGRPEPPDHSRVTDSWGTSRSTLRVSTVASRPELAWQQSGNAERLQAFDAKHWTVRHPKVHLLDKLSTGGQGMPNAVLIRPRSRSGQIRSETADRLERLVRGSAASVVNCPRNA
jgi:hypothetical protein